MKSAHFTRSGYRLINFLLRSFSLKLVRISDSKKTIKGDRRVAGLIVECIGPSGIGKTTANKIFQPSSKYGWNFDYPAGSNIKIDQFSSDPRLDFFYNKLLLKKSESVFSRDLTALHANNLMQFMCLRAKQDYALSQLMSIDENLGFWLEDGIFHNFSKEILQGLESGDMDPKAFGNRVIINFTTESSVIVERLRKRHRENSTAGNNWFRVYGEHAIHSHVDAILDTKRRLTNALRQIGLLAYTVDATNQEELADQLQIIEENIVLHNGLDAGAEKTAEYG